MSKIGTIAIYVEADEEWEREEYQNKQVAVLPKNGPFYLWFPSVTAAQIWVHALVRVIDPGWDTDYDRGYEAAREEFQVMDPAARARDRYVGDRT